MTTSKRTTRHEGTVQPENGAAAPVKARVSRKKSPPGSSPSNSAPSSSAANHHHEDRHASIARAAYFRSQLRGFEPGFELEDWLAAEAEVDQRSRGEERPS